MAPPCDNSSSAVWPCSVNRLPLVLQLRRVRRWSRHTMRLASRWLQDSIWNF